MSRLASRRWVGTLGFAFLLDAGKGIEEGKARIALGRGGQVERSLGQVKAPFGHPDIVESLRAGDDDPQGVGVRHTDVFTRKDEHAAKNEARVLASVDHARHPVEGRVGIGAAQTLDEGADGVVVDVAFLVIQHGPALDALLRHLQRDADNAVRPRRCGLYGQLQGVEHPARVPVGDIDQMVQRIVVQGHLQLAVAAFRVGQGLAGDGKQVVAR